MDQILISKVLQQFRNDTRERKRQTAEGGGALVVPKALPGLFGNGTFVRKFKELFHNTNEKYI